MSKVFDSYAAYYDLLYIDKNYKLEVDYIFKLLKKYKFNSGEILELGSGTGKHAAYLAGLGFNIHGIDLSESMINIANSQNKLENISFEVGDVRTYRVDKLFDVVLSLFHVASYQSTNSDLQNMFLTASSHLAPGGVFIFDFWYGPAVLNNLPTIRTKKMNDKIIDVVRVATPEIRCNKNIVDVNYNIKVTNIHNKQVSVFNETHSMRYLFMPELEKMLEDLNIEILDQLTWMTQDELNLDSWQGIIVAKKMIK